MSGATMRAVEISAVGRARVIEVDRPAPGPGEVQIRILANGICGSDVAAYLGKHPYRVPPVISGHEPVGVISEVGVGVNRLREGEMVVVEPHIGCGTCRECRAGRYNICRNKRVLGTPKWPGSFAEHIISPMECVHSVEGKLTREQAVLIEPLSVATHSVRVAGLTGGERIAILGCGPIGLMHVLAVSQLHPQQLVCCDIKDFNLETALRIGATTGLNPNHANVPKEVGELTGGEGLDAAFVVFHSAELVQMAIAMVKPGGTVVLVANFPDSLELSFQRAQLAEIRLLGTAMYTREDYARSIEHAPLLGERLTSLITHRINLTETPDYLERLARGRLPAVVKVIVATD